MGAVVGQKCDEGGMFLPPAPVLLSSFSRVAVRFNGGGASVDTPKLATLGTEQNNLGSSENVTVVCLGDSHSKHADFTVPAGDVLLHSGDFSKGRRSMSSCSTMG